MFCDEALDQIEAIATGDLVPGERVAAHLASCPQCAAALAGAQRIERLLRSQTAVTAPAPFAGRVVTRLRRERWRSEQYVDVGFNLALAVAVLAVVGGVWILFSRSGLSAVGSDVVALFGDGAATLARRVAPAVPLYLGATALLGAALGLWWWAERGGNPTA